MKHANVIQEGQNIWRDTVPKAMLTFRIVHGQCTYANRKPTSYIIFDGSSNVRPSVTILEIFATEMCMLVTLAFIIGQSHI